MRRSTLTAACLLLAGCSFIDDFDKFRIESANTQIDAATKRDASVRGDAAVTRDAQIEAGAELVDCTKVKEGTVCGRGENLLCIDEICRASVCGDGYLDKQREEQCEDLNLVPSDGCEPQSCRYSCEADADCDNRFICDGKEKCVDHACIDGDISPALQGDACKRYDQVDGSCDSGYCVPASCGNAQVDANEDCDGTSGCRPDCTMGCVSDAQCSDNNACNGQEDCALATGECKPGSAPVCSDGDACSLDACEPSESCVYTLIDGDRDGYAEATCEKDSKLKGGDCNDDSPIVFPGATEYCDGLDNDCDGSKDEGSVKADCYPDSDGDGFPVQGSAIKACTCPKGRMPARDDGKWDCWDDPDDAGRDIFPGQTTSFALGYDAHCESESGPCKIVKNFDYDCDGDETPLYTASGSTSCGALSGALGCSPSGYMGNTPPACGDAAAYLTCTPNGGLLGGCSSATSQLLQACR